MAQYPAPGARVERGAVVTLIESSGLPFVSVPSIRGLSVSTAQRMLHGLKLQPRLGAAYSNALPYTVVQYESIVDFKFRPGPPNRNYDDALAAFVPDASPLAIFPAGAASGCTSVGEALASGHRAGLAAAARAGFRPTRELVPPRAVSAAMGPLKPLWAIPSRRGGKCFVDLQDDVTVDDILLSVREGYRSVEHLKRYTTLGMGTDQGKLANIAGLALLAQELGVPVAQVGTTTFRPPYTPISLGAVAGPESGAHVEPTRCSAMHDWQAQEFVDPEPRLRVSILVPAEDPPAAVREIAKRAGKLHCRMITAQNARPRLCVQIVLPFSSDSCRSQASA